MHGLQLHIDFANTIPFFCLCVHSFIHTHEFTDLCQLYVWVFTQWPLAPLIITIAFSLTFTPQYCGFRYSQVSFHGCILQLMTDAPTHCLSVAFTSLAYVCGFHFLFFLFLGRYESKEMSSVLRNSGTHSFMWACTHIHSFPTIPPPHP